MNENRKENEEDLLMWRNPHDMIKMGESIGFRINLLSERCKKELALKP